MPGSSPTDLATEVWKCPLIGQPGVVSPMFDYTESYTIANASLAFAFERVTVGAYVENLFDDRSITYVHPEAFLDGRYARVPPRTIGVRVGYRF